MTQAIAHVRPVRKTRARLSKFANARDTIAGFGHGMDVVGLTFGQFSLLDLIDAALEITGPADVTVSTWSAGFYDVDAAERFRDSGRMRIRHPCNIPPHVQPRRTQLHTRRQKA